VKKRFFCVFLTIALLLCFIPVQAEAAGGVEDAIIESCQTGENVNIAEYQLTEEALEKLYIELYNRGALPWYAARNYTFLFDQQSGLIKTFLPKALPEDTYDRVRYSQRVAEIMQAAVFEDMSQWQKALSVHDYLIANCTYDESLAHNTGYDLLVNGTSVCAGYAEAYMDIMNRLGIPCVMVESEAMDHAWNLICIDGSWYHVDLTWDDPTPDNFGKVSHEYFLLTDEEMLAEGEEGHYGWETDITCTDTSMQDAFWQGVESQICYLDGSTSYYRWHEEWTSYICSRNESDGTYTVLFTDEERYIDIGAGEYTYFHAGLSLWNGRLYFSTMDAVYSMAPDGSDQKLEFSYNTAGNSKYIFTCSVSDDTIYMTLMDHEDHQLNQTVSLPEPSNYHVHSYTPTILPPDCISPGETYYSCSCGITVEGSLTEPTGHSYEVSSVDDPTPFQEGTVYYTCEGCGDTYTESISKISLFKWIYDWFFALFS